VPPTLFYGCKGLVIMPSAGDGLALGCAARQEGQPVARLVEYKSDPRRRKFRLTDRLAEKETAAAICRRAPRDQTATWKMGEQPDVTKIVEFDTWRP